jgi:hypothetical protein
MDYGADKVGTGSQSIRLDQKSSKLRNPCNQLSNYAVTTVTRFFFGGGWVKKEIALFKYKLYFKNSIFKYAYENNVNGDLHDTKPSVVYTLGWAKNTKECH